MSNTNNNNSNTVNNETTTAGIRLWQFSKDALNWGDYVVEVRGVDKYGSGGPTENASFTIQHHRTEEEIKSRKQLQQTDQLLDNLEGGLDFPE